MYIYIKLLRPAHWIKNGLIFSAAVFSGNLFSSYYFTTIALGFLAFCFLSSSIYIINDIRDVSVDRNHDIKKNRPIASGKVKIPTAGIISGVLFALALIINYIASNGSNRILTYACIITYFLVNLFYSLGLKNVPLVDISILVLGFFLRILYGNILIDIPVSLWLYLTVISLSFFMGLGKRRNELMKGKENDKNLRNVLKYYNYGFLDKNMYMFLTLTLVFYALWSIDLETVANRGAFQMYWTVPLVILICLSYSHAIETSEYADPVDILLQNKGMLMLVLVYMACVLYVLYSKVVF